MDLNRELLWICNLLEEGGVKFWVDSGTLLGLTREGGVMQDDHDIDLSMWSENESLLDKLLPAVEQRGYRVSVKSYRGLNFKYKFTPQFKGSSLDVDISLFRLKDNHAWCPQVYCKPFPSSKGSPFYYLRALPRKLVQVLFVRRKKVAVEGLFWALSYKIYLVWVPKQYFEETVRIAGNIPAPRQYEDYLSYRYGDWQVPQKDWFFIFDDGAIRRQSPESLIGQIKA